MAKNQLPEVKPMSLSINTPDDNLASEFFKRIVQMIHDFDEKLEQTHQVGMRLVSFGQAVTFHVTHVGYSDPSLIVFSGKLEDGSQVNLVQHVSQISFLLMAVERKDPLLPKNPIGFLPPR
ncbi:DUF6173 family protein [Paenibacillus contaminans]|nr:DUF6173 family protein [Paenibacillus contaminans]